MRIVQSPELEAVESCDIPGAWDVPWRFFLEAPRDLARGCYVPTCSTCDTDVRCERLDRYTRSRIFAGQCRTCRTVYWTRRL